jgi:uncharacterized protein
MGEIIQIPMFPLGILPLPGELIPLHIFEPRYKQLLEDAETSDAGFGIFCSHEINQSKIGSLVRLESVIKRYSGGEADIIVKCQDVFTMSLLLRTFKNKMYPGGDVRFWNVDQNQIPGQQLYESFLEYLTLRKISSHFTTYTFYQVAYELSLDINDRYKFLLPPDDKKENFLLSQVKYQIHLLNQESNSKDVYHLN